MFPPNLDGTIIQIGLIFLVLLVGLVHLYLDQFNEPKSDIQFSRPTGVLDHGPLEDDRVEIHFKFSANNRGDDNGWVDRANLVRFEFCDSREFDDVFGIETEKLTTPSGNKLPIPPGVKLEKDERTGPVLVPKGNVVSFKGVGGVYSDDLKKIYHDYRYARAAIEFHCRDNAREYSRNYLTDELDLWWNRNHPPSEVDEDTWEELESRSISDENLTTDKADYRR